VTAELPCQVCSPKKGPATTNTTTQKTACSGFISLACHGAFKLQVEPAHMPDDKSNDLLLLTRHGPSFRGYENLDVPAIDEHIFPRALRLLRQT
jgi:hypothetical protein